MTGDAGPASRWTGRCPYPPGSGRSTTAEAIDRVLPESGLSRPGPGPPRPASSARLFAHRGWALDLSERDVRPDDDRQAEKPRLGAFCVPQPDALAAHGPEESVPHVQGPVGCGHEQHVTGDRSFEKPPECRRVLIAQHEAKRDRGIDGDGDQRWPSRMRSDADSGPGRALVLISSSSCSAARRDCRSPSLRPGRTRATGWPLSVKTVTTPLAAA